MKIQSNGAPGVLAVSRCYWLRRRGVISLLERGSCAMLKWNFWVRKSLHCWVCFISWMWIIHKHMQEMGLSVLQYVIFKDTNVPKDIACQFKTAMESYNDFKDSMQWTAMFMSVLLLALLVHVIIFFIRTMS